MEIEVMTKGTVVDITFYVIKLLEGLEVVVYESPGMKNTFIVNENSKKLVESERKEFHLWMARLEATVEDQRKLMRVLGYLKGMQEATLLLSAMGVPMVVAYVDAAYAIHNDSKSHSGVIAYVGHTLVYVSLRKQKCISKSPTEAELIALTDNVGLVELFKEFVEFLVMKKIPVLIVYKDCNAVVSLVTLGGGVTRTKHLRAMMHLGKEMIDEGGIRVIYKKGEDMLADGMSKPYDPVCQTQTVCIGTIGRTEIGQRVGAGRYEQEKEKRSRARVSVSILPDSEKELKREKELWAMKS